MTINIALDELLTWNGQERAKWLSWLKANPGAPDVCVQAGGRFPTVGALVAHIFLVEVRAPLCHMLLHEVRHWAQIAFCGTDRRLRAARRARLVLFEGAGLTVR